MEKDKERLAVIENIKKCLNENNLNSKVENGDPDVSSEVLNKLHEVIELLEKSY